MNSAATDVRMDEFSKDEWWDVARALRPDWSEEDFDQAWAEFVALKSKKAAN